MPQKHGLCKLQASFVSLGCQLSLGHLEHPQFPRIGLGKICRTCMNDHESRIMNGMEQSPSRFALKRRNQFLLQSNQ